MTTVSGLDSDIYNHNFSIEEARELISTCLDKFDKSNPDCILLLKTISKLTDMMNMADYDYTVLKNLISENTTLVEQYKELRLKQVSLQNECNTLKEKLNQNERHQSHSKSSHLLPDPRFPHHLSMAELDSNNANVNLRVISI